MPRGGDVAGLVRHPRALGQPGGDAIVEFLGLENPEELTRGHAAQHLHRVGAEASDQPGGALGWGDRFEQDVGGQIARAHDHPLCEMPHGAFLAKRRIQGRIAVIARGELVVGAIHDRGKAVGDRHRIAPSELARVHPSPQSHQHGYFHGAGGVEAEVGVLHCPGRSARGSRRGANPRDRSDRPARVPQGWRAP